LYIRKEKMSTFKPTFQVPKSARYLHVPFEYKDEAKQLGAWYDPAKKSWYCTDKHTSKDILIQMFGDKSESKLRMYLHPNPENPTVGPDGGTSWDDMKLFIAELKGIKGRYDKERKEWYIYRNHPKADEYSEYEIDA